MTTTTSTHDTPSGPALPEIPPMSMATMAVGLTDLLDEATDLPQPRYITIHEIQAISLGFDPVPESLQTLTRWALRFGAVLVSERTEATAEPCTYIHARFSYRDIAVTAYALIPDRDGS
jgi:hypothetical protein